MAKKTPRTRSPETASDPRPRPRPKKCRDFETDYVGIAYFYAQEAADKKNSHRFCKWIRLAAKRFLADLERAALPNPPFTFSSWHASDPCDFIEKLPHVEGKWKDAEGNDSPNIILHASDVFFIVQLFGFRDLEGNRRFTVALKAVARKNAKSTIAGAIGLYCETCEGETGPQVISAATTGQQARIVFNIAKKMVERTPALCEAFHMKAFANAIACYGNGGTFKPINAKASTQDGLNPSTSIIDEVHAHKNHDLINVIQSAAGARSNPLFLYTTTEGYDTPGPWPELRHFAKQVLTGVVTADHFLCVFYTLDDKDEEEGIEEDDDFDESVWVKANPLLDCNPILLRELKKAAVDAKAMPGKLPEFRIKRLNRQSSNAQGWISYSHWKKCASKVDYAKLKNLRAYGGLDLASTTDLASFRLIWELDDLIITKGWRWCPENMVSLRTERGSIPYVGWVEAGHIKQTPGEVIDYDVVEKDIEEICNTYDVKMIGYDQWNALQTSKRLKEKGIPMRLFIQGTKSYHPAMKAFEELYIAGNFTYGEEDPVLTWCASNLIVRKDVNLNMAPDRRKSFEKIDDMVALLMALGTMLTEEEKPEPTMFFV